MFRKLISDLPFNPSLLGHVAFYAGRMKSEASLRRLGCLFVALAMFIQMFAVMEPPEKSLAYSSDYIVNGLSTKDDLLRAWDGKSADKHVAEIYGAFGLTRDDIAALTPTPNVTLRSDKADYWTIGRTSLSAVSKTGKIKQQYKDSEIPVNVGPTSVYLRQLRAWDIVNPYNSYKAWQGVKNGKKFWILVDCGNFTTESTPPVAPPSSPTPEPLKNPALDFRKTIEGTERALKPGDQFTFRFEYRNKVENSTPAKDVVLTDMLDLNNFEVVTPKNLPLTGNKLIYPIGTVAYSPEYKTALRITVKLKTNLANGLKVCNSASLQASNTPSVSSGGSGLCVTVLNPCPLDPNLSQTDPACVAPVVVCKVSNSDVNRTTKTFTLSTEAISSNQALTSIQSYVYDFGDGSPVITQRSSTYQDTITHQYQDGHYEATVVVNYKIGGGAGQSDGSVACSESIEAEADQPLSQAKTARNLTRNLDHNATLATAAKAGESIEYTLTMHNSFSYERTNVSISDYIGDILDYATLDNAYLAQQGGTYNEDSKTVSWTGISVAANSSATKTFRVQMKDPIPSTNQPGAMTTAYDCQMSNRFGNQLDLKVDCPLPKSAEYITERLPNTGPGTGMAIAVVGTVIAAYFFARSRLLAKELEIIRTDFANTGGI